MFSSAAKTFVVGGTVFGCRWTSSSWHEFSGSAMGDGAGYWSGLVKVGIDPVDGLPGALERVCSRSR